MLKAYHDEILARDQSIGLLFEVPFEGPIVRRLLFTGDTGLFPQTDDGGVKLPDTSGEEVWKTYGLVAQEVKLT